MRATAGPDVVDALVHLASVTVGPDVEVVDGYAVQPGEAALLIIGASDPNDPTGAPGFTSRQDRMPGFPPDGREVTSVVCRFHAPPVGTPKEARDYLAGQLNTLKTALYNDPQLGGAVDEARLAEMGWRMFAGPSGDELVCDLIITADCYLN